MTYPQVTQFETRARELHAWVAYTDTRHPQRTAPQRPAVSRSAASAVLNALFGRTGRFAPLRRNPN